MKTITAITTFHPQGYHEYAKHMIESFDRYWPEDIVLHAYYEDVKPNIGSNRIIYKDINDTCPDLVEFKKRHKDNPKAHGNEDRGPHKTRRNQRVGMGFHWDAVRFSHKSYVISHALRTIDSDLIFWLDADTKTFDFIPKELLEGLINDELCCYLGRTNQYTETGFVGYNKRHPNIIDLANGIKHYYDSDKVFTLKEWHDCEVFDTVRKQLEEKGCSTNNLSAHLHKVKHPFINTVLGDYMDHLKGPRKQTGKSNPTDIKIKRDNEYWNSRQ